MDHLINEVDEDLRRERRQNFWRNFGRHIVTFSILIVVATAAIVGWKNYQTSQKEGWTAALLEADDAISLKKYAEAKAALTPVFEDGSKALSMFAGLRLTEIALAEKNISEAKELLESKELSNLKGDNKLYSQLRDLLLLASSNEVPADSMAIGGEAFSLIEKEIIAARYIAKGENAKAEQVLISLVENAITPNDIKTRAKLLITYLKEKK